MSFKRTFLSLMLLSTLAPVALAIPFHCGSKITVNNGDDSGVTCTLSEAGNNGDGRTYCLYNCSDGTQTLLIG